MKNINDVPEEVLDQILTFAAEANKAEGVLYTFGLKSPLHSQERIQKYVKGPVPPALLKWDAVAAIRLVCGRWHEWSIQYALRDIFVKRWRGAERWCDLSLQRDRYGLYEMIDYPRGEKVYRDPYLTLRRTRALLTKFPTVAACVRRLHFDGLYVPETDSQIIETVTGCFNLTTVSLPWTILRSGTASDWEELLGMRRQLPLRSLELLATALSEKQTNEARKIIDQRPLDSRRVNFSQLKRLKLFGDTKHNPIDDADLKAIARSATGLENFQITCMSTVSLEGVIAIVKASRKTLRVLEHSPRSQDGFLHPDPGSLVENEHICNILTSCPKLEDLSISIPSMCAELFSNSNVRWKGECQVRALHLCGHSEGTTSNASIADMREVLQQSRRLISRRASCRFPERLTIELFFADFIFDPHINSVHGDFSLAEMIANGTWPYSKAISRKGPYGTTGLYGKNDEEHPFDRLSEDEFFAGVTRSLLQL